VERFRKHRHGRFHRWANWRKQGDGKGWNAQNEDSDSNVVAAPVENSASSSAPATPTETLESQPNVQVASFEVATTPPSPISSKVAKASKSKSRSITSQAKSTSSKAKPTRKPKPSTTSRTEASTTAEPTTTSQAATPPESGLSAFAIEALKAHNDERAQHGAEPLVWSDDLENAAQAWTDKCVFEHGGGKALGAGENLAQGYSSISASVAGWNAESKDYNPEKPDYSHWTQVVWKDTTQLGCAVTECKGGALYACEYLKGGNVYWPEPNPYKGFDDNVEL